VAAALRALRARFDYVVVDTAPTLEEHVLHVLDAADRIVLPMTLELTAVKNARLLLDLLGALGCPPERLVLVLNRAGSRAGVSAKEAEQVLGRRFAAEVASDWRLATLAGEKGIPLVTADPEALVSRHIAALARTLAGIGAPATGEARPRWTGGLLRTMLGTGKRPSAAPAGVPGPATGPRGRGAPAPPPGRGAGPARSAPAGARVGLRPAAAPS
jgi:pilus assembly protein CpaE